MQELESDDETINDGLLYEEDDFLLSPVPGSAVRSHSMELPLAGEETSEKSLELKSKTSSPKRRGSLGGSDHSSRSKSPSTWRTHSPGTRRALKKSLMFGGDGNDIGGSSDSRRSCSSSHLRERLLNGNNGSSHSRRGNSHHGSSHFRDRQTNNSTTGLESSLRGSSHIREKLLGPGNGDNAVNIGSSNCRVRSRNMIQTAKEASSGSTLENENDQLIGSDHSLPNQLITTGPRISWKSDAKASFCDWR